MDAEDKAAHKTTEFKGKVKQGAGDVLDDDQLRAEGKADEAEGNFKQAGDKLRDAAEKVKDTFTK